ncbi:hypothetical protein DNH61_03470 [Paenibacillus sambharensis]|uniref:Uncharacterized protein n=1 Tax=Paenibacillus sambharensis TaxID=1803190 RepID=A0A2W1LFE0_9BACL|nr:DUF6179 domain-containing protein [Paenibacillus sambharensis]PZD97419.1 hypothetical protein DNH61_03470 [Paenibacillus sambharensis]
MESEHLNVSRELTTRDRVQKTRLQGNQYTISLMNAGLQAGLLTSQEVARIQSAFMEILRDLIHKHTRGESTSVTTETAENILTSILYASDAYLLSFEEPEKAITYLKAVDPRRIYDKGVEKVNQCLEEVKLLYKELKASKLEIPVDAYNMTIDESLPVFFRKYGVIFDAHNTMASIDYPLAVDDMRLQGVFYMKQYMERLKLETGFCALYGQQELLSLLANYGRECRFNYRIELFNIFELVMSNAVFSILSGGAANTLRISEIQYLRLEQQLSSLAKPQIRTLINEAVASLQQELTIDSELKAYMDRCQENLIQRVKHAAKHNTLRKVIITEREDETKSLVVYFNKEERMSDVQLRSVLQEIMAFDRKEDKVNLIRSSFHSFHDYLDMLESDCLYGEEYEALFRSFGVTELAILAKIVFCEELRSESLNLSSILLLEQHFQAEWQMQFVQSLQRMSRDRLEAVERNMNDIDYEHMTFY